MASQKHGLRRRLASRRALGVAVGMLLAIGCVTPPRQRIGYSVNDVMDLSGGPLSKMTLFVRAFADQRTLAMSDSSSWHETVGAGYEQDVSPIVTSMIVSHLS